MSTNKDDSKASKKHSGSANDMSCETLKTEEDKTLAEDDQNDKNSGAESHRFERINVVIKMAKGKKFGLGIILVHQRILVCKVDNDSLVHGVLQLGDQILEVDKVTVSDKVKCKKLLMASLNKKGQATILVIRPKTPDALCAIMEEIHISKKPSQESLPVSKNKSELNHP